jgi:LPPG:FO 2-phospho-L-lactate transferase
VVDHADARDLAGLRPRVTTARTLMTTLADREALARVVLDAIAALR